MWEVIGRHGKNREGHGKSTSSPHCVAGVELAKVFKLNTTGTLCIDPNVTLDREQTASTNLVVRATDNCYEASVPEVMAPSGSNAPPLYSSTNASYLWVKVMVDDVNDHQPVFARADLAVGLTRTTQFGAIIYNLKVRFYLLMV